MPPVPQPVARPPYPGGISHAPAKPDPVKDAADRIGEALAGKPGLSGQIFNDAAQGASGIDAGGRTIVDAINKGAKDPLTPGQQEQAIDQYVARPGSGHTVHKDDMDGGKAITVEPKPAGTQAVKWEPLGYII